MWGLGRIAEKVVAKASFQVGLSGFPREGCLRLFSSPSCQPHQRFMMGAHLSLPTGLAKQEQSPSSVMISDLFIGHFRGKGWAKKILEEGAK